MCVEGDDDELDCESCVGGDFHAICQLVFVCLVGCQGVTCEYAVMWIRVLLPLVRFVTDAELHRWCLRCPKH